jgi:peptidyl-tRNA hydrolase ICT1
MSRYYTAGTDSLTFQAQTERRRASNLEENKAKLMKELRRIYREVVPGETNPEDIRKYENAEKKFHERRIQNKKLHSAKKHTRRGPNE